MAPARSIRLHSRPSVHKSRRVHHHPCNEIIQEVNYPNEEDVVLVVPQTMDRDKPKHCKIPAENCNQGREVGAVVSGKHPEMK
jgi:hypothetical protein